MGFQNMVHKQRAKETTLMGIMDMYSRMEITVNAFDVSSRKNCMLWMQDSLGNRMPMTGLVVHTSQYPLGSQNFLHRARCH